MKTISYPPWKSISFLYGSAYAILPILTSMLVGYFWVVSQDGLLIRESKAAINAEIDAILAYGVESKIIENRLTSSGRGYVIALKQSEAPEVIGNPVPWDSFEEREGWVFFELEHGAVDLYQSSRSESGHHDLMGRVVEGKGWSLLVARDIDDLEITQWVTETFSGLLVFILLGMAILGILLGLLWSRRLGAIADATQNIMTTGNLSQRIPPNVQWDDLGRLVVVLNRLLEKVEHLMGDVQTATHQIAHNLKTPLTRLRSTLENVQPEDLRRDLSEDADQLLSMFNGLLRIASVERNLIGVELMTIELSPILSDIVDLYSPLAEEKGLELRSEIDDLSAPMDRDLFFQAVSNLIDNSIKYTPTGGFISLELKSKVGVTELTVTDSGHGIPTDEKNEVLKKFTRLEGHLSEPGLGLGLAFVLSVVQGTGGEFHLEDAEPGLRVRWILNP